MAGGKGRISLLGRPTCRQESLHRQLRMHQALFSSWTISDRLLVARGLTTTGENILKPSCSPFPETGIRAARYSFASLFPCGIPAHSSQLEGADPLRNPSLPFCPTGHRDFGSFGHASGGQSASRTGCTIKSGPDSTGTPTPAKSCGPSEESLLPVPVTKIVDHDSRWDSKSRPFSTRVLCHAKHPSSMPCICSQNTG